MRAALASSKNTNANVFVAAAALAKAAPTCRTADENQMPSTFSADTSGRPVPVLCRTLAVSRHVQLVSTVTSCDVFFSGVFGTQVSDFV